MSKPQIIGVGMTEFRRHPERSLKALSYEAVVAALKDAGMEASLVELAVVGNGMAGIMTGQESVRGQVVLRGTGVDGIPIINVENACASSSTALHVACNAIQSGQVECALVVGVEKLYHPDRRRTVQALRGGTEVAEQEGEVDEQSPLIKIYAERVRRYMALYDLSVQHLAWVSAKNHQHAVHNPFAQYRTSFTPEQVLNSPIVAEPLTRLMCSPITDGAAAAIVVSERMARRLGQHPVTIQSSVLVSGSPSVDHDNESVIGRAARQAYTAAGIAPEDVHVAEVHDATASGELLAYAALKWCAPGDEPRLVKEQTTALGGRLPVNPSGGLEAKGNPSGATGLGQIAELVWQLRGEAGQRQVPNARVALAENAGGVVADRTAAVCVHILSR